LLTSTFYHKGQFLKENELLPLEKCCVFCRSENRKRAAVLQEQPDVYLYECLDCRAVSASRMPLNEVLAKYYSHYYDNNSLKVASGNVERVAQYLYDGFSGHFKGGDSLAILDFGGGNGAIAYALAKGHLLNKYKNISITVVDYAETRKSEIPEITLKHYETLSQIDSGKFDLVLASVVLEHIPYPEPVLENLLFLLKENGLIYARTPFILPIFNLLKKVGIQMDFTYPGHLHDLGQEFWQNRVRALNRSGELKILSSRPSMVDTEFSQDFIRTLAAYLLKFPWYLLRKSYGFVGGWEIFIIRGKSPTKSESADV
jgi:SAM-dependent methyltransferase